MKNLKKFGEVNEVSAAIGQQRETVLREFAAVMDKISRGYAQTDPLFDVKVDDDKMEITATKLDPTSKHKDGHGGKFVFAFKKYIPMQ